MPHSFAFQVRWADLDVLHHVTNAVYVQYGVDALAALAAERPLPTVVGFDITYRVPLVYGARDPRVETSQEGDSVRQRIVSGSDGGATVHASLTLLTGPRLGVEPTEVDAAEYGYLLRQSDLDQSGHVSLVGMCRMVQESRAALPETIAAVHGSAPLVVGRVDCRLGAPLGFTADPVPVRIWVHGMTRSTVVMYAEVVVGRSVVGQATTVLVGLHESGVGSRPLSDDERALFGGLLRRSVPAT